MGLADLPTLAEVEALRRGKPIEKGKTKLEARIEAKPLTIVDEKAFRSEVWTRDKSKCRCCGRKVLKTIKRTAERGEVHHIHGKRGDLRFEDRAALLLCLLCHDRVTGRINDRLRIVATQTFTMRTETYTDARHPVTFQKVA